MITPSPEAHAGSPPRRPALRWHGGKWKLAPWIIGHFPAHRIYVEPFGGAMSVLLRKKRSYAEVYNDLDDEAVNLFRVLQDRRAAAALMYLLRLTPFARSEFVGANTPAIEPVERARKLIIRSFMGFGSNAHSSSPTACKTGFRSFSRAMDAARFQAGTRAAPRAGPGHYRSTGFRANSERSGTTPAHDWANYPDSLALIVARLVGVVIESRDASKVMAQHDCEQTLHYVDPPYLPETRSPANKYDLKHRMYRHELTVDDHAKLLAFLRALKGMVVLSGYPSAMYDHALPDWCRVSTEALADGARKRIEVLWLNPACAAALEAEGRTTTAVQMPLMSDQLLRQTASPNGNAE